MHRITDGFSSANRLSTSFFDYNLSLMNVSYVISLLANLNARPRKNASSNGSAGGPSHITTIAFSPRLMNREDDPSPSSFHDFSTILRSLGTSNLGPEVSSRFTDLEAQLSRNVEIISISEGFPELESGEKSWTWVSKSF
jgi:hypothetical protein